MHFICYIYTDYSKYNRIVYNDCDWSRVSYGPNPHRKYHMKNDIVTFIHATTWKDSNVRPRDETDDIVQVLFTQALESYNTSMLWPLCGLIHVGWQYNMNVTKWMYNSKTIVYRLLATYGRQAWSA